MKQLNFNRYQEESDLDDEELLRLALMVSTSGLRKKLYRLRLIRMKIYLKGSSKLKKSNPRFAVPVKNMKKRYNPFWQGHSTCRLMKKATSKMQNTDDVQVVDNNTTDKGNLELSDLASFLNEGNEEVVQDQIAEETNEQLGVSEEVEVEDNVLSQSEEVSEEVEEESDESDDSEVDDTEDEDLNLSKKDKKFLKQISRLTARSKSAEEQVAQLQAQVNSLQLDNKVKENPGIEDITTMDELEQLRQEALNAKKWARANEDEDYVTDGDKEFTKKEIKQIRDKAEEHLEELIPERMKFLQMKTNSEQLALQDFPFIKEEESDAFKLLQNMIADKNFKPLDKLPNGLYLRALMVEGVNALNARKKGKGKAEKGETKPPSMPGNDDVSPSVRNKDSDRDRRKKILGDSVISRSIDAFNFLKLIYYGISNFLFFR